MASEAAEKVLRWIDYCEYVAAWTEIPIRTRPKCRVIRFNGEWTGVLANSATERFPLSAKDGHLVMLPSDTIVTGFPVVTVSVKPDELSERAGLPWREVDTELGAARVAIVRLSAGPRFALSTYEEAPWPSVTIAADSDATEQDVDQLLLALKIRRREVFDRVAIRHAIVPTEEPK